MLPLVTALFLCQQAPPPQPAVATVVSRRTGVTPARAAKILERLEQQLLEAQVVTLPRAEVTTRLGRLGLKDATFCAAKRVCLAELGSQLPADIVVGVSLALLKPDLSIVIDAARASDGVIVAEFSMAVGQATKEAELSFAPFAQSLAAALTPRTPDPVVDVPSPPPVVSLVPTSPEAPLLPVVEARPLAPAIATGGGALVFVAAGVTLTALSLSTNASLANGQSLPDGRVRSPLTEHEALARRDTANAELNVAIGCGVTAVALGVVTWLLWPSKVVTP